MLRKFCYWWLSFFFLLFNMSCNSIWGDHSLGNNLSLLEGDRKEDRIIVYCTGNCHGGIYVIPTYERHMTNGRYAEYVELATSNKEWVIVKTLRVEEKQENYWIISKDFDITDLDCSKANCDSILQSHVTGPLSVNDFENKKKKLNIDLDF